MLTLHAALSYAEIHQKPGNKLAVFYVLWKRFQEIRSFQVLNEGDHDRR